MKKALLAALVAVVLFLCPKSAAPSPWFRPSDVAQYLLTEKANQVVMLTPPSRHSTGGTGFELRTPTGKILTITNKHICELAENGFIAARVPGTERWVNLKVIERAKDTDLCAAEALPGATGLTMAEGLKEFSKVYVMGHPLLESIRVAEGNLLTRETIQLGEEEPDADKCIASGGTPKKVDSFFGSVQICVTEVDSYPISAQIYPGNSGSPMFNESGEVTGVVFAADRRTNMGFVIPYDVLKTFISMY